MRRVSGLTAAFTFVLAGSAIAEPAPQDSTAATVATVGVPPLPDGAKPRPIGLTRVRIEQKPGDEVGYIRMGALCVAPVPVTWSVISSHFDKLPEIFAEELKAAGFKVDKDPDNMFAEAASTDLQVGVRLTKINVGGCLNPLVNSLHEEMAFQWQVYSTLRHELVATIDTSATVDRKGAKGGGFGGVALRANIRQLLANESFRAIVLAADPAIPSGSAAGGRFEPINIAEAPRRATRIADATGAVVAIFAGEGFGSGVLVSVDGYVVTAQHVVSDAQTVRVRWSDGFETTGEVVRSDKRRDVALVKTDTHGRSPLAVNRRVPPAGAPVYAIGTPLDPKLQSTVTRGVVSAMRVVNGFSFIQSDTPVTHGNSGGPLLDETGAVIGLTDWGFSPEETTSLNFFIPIGDAMDFLALKPAA